MHPTGWIAAALSAFVGAWLAFDGTRAMLVGSYVTPKSGAHAGQLGPWALLVRAAGLDPNSTTIRLLHVGLGLALVASAVLITLNPRLGARCLLLVCVCGLWYLPWGTILLGGALALLLLGPMRSIAFT